MKYLKIIYLWRWVFIMSRSRFTSEQKVRVCREYLSCKKSAIQLATELDLGKSGGNSIRE